MAVARPSLPDPPGSIQLRVLRDAGIVSLTNEPGATPPGQGGQGGSPSEPDQAAVRVVPGVSCIARGFGLLVVGFGCVMLISSLIAAVVSDVPQRINGRPASKAEVIGVQLGLLAFFVAFGAGWYYLVGQILGGSVSRWQLDLGDDDWVLRQGRLRRIVNRVSAREIEGLTRDRRGRVMAETTEGSRRPITGPMGPDESAWAVQALSRFLAHPTSAGPVEESEVLPHVPVPDPQPSPGTILAYRLARADHPGKSALGLLAISAFWNGITWVVVWAMATRKGAGGRPEQQLEGWQQYLFFGFFILVGLVLLGLFLFAVWTAIRDSLAGASIVEVSVDRLRAGGRHRAFVSQPIRGGLDSLRVCLVCSEEVRYRSANDDSMTTESRRVRELEVFRRDGLSVQAGLPFEATFDLEVPEDAMHSLELPNNKVLWRLELEGGPGDPPRFRREYPIVVLPPRRSGVAT